MTSIEEIQVSFTRIEKAAHEAIDKAYLRGLEVGIRKLANDLIKKDIDDIPFPSGMVKETAGRLLEEIKAKKEKKKTAKEVNDNG